MRSALLATILFFGLPVMARLAAGMSQAAVIALLALRGIAYGAMPVRLKEAPFVAGDRFSVAGITTLVTVDFATRAFRMPLPADALAFRRWHDVVPAPPGATA